MPPWSFAIALQERVDLEDITRWARRDIEYPLRLCEEEKPEFSVKKLLSALMFIIP